MSSPIEILWTTTAFECSLADEKGRILAKAPEGVVRIRSESQGHCLI